MSPGYPAPPVSGMMVGWKPRWKTASAAGTNRSIDIWRATWSPSDPFMEKKMTTLFQETIEYLLKSHNLLEDFQNKDSFHVRFEKTGYQPLVIERHGEMISVAHYFEQNGDLIADPDVELHYPSWGPTGITQAPIGDRHVAD